MKPVLFYIGSIEFQSYPLMIMVGVLAAVYIGYRLARSRGLPVVYVLDMAILGILLGFAGARLAHVVVEKPFYYLEHPLQILFFWQGGFVSWGAHLFVLAGWYFYLRWRRQPVWAYFDIAALSVPAALFFGRIACFLQGCCFGKPTSLPIGIAFNNPASDAFQFYPHIPLHPTQIYLMLNALIIFGLLGWVVFRRWKFQGQIFSLLLILYAVGRFVIEFFRGDADRGVYFDGWISSGQIAMVFFLAVGLVFYGYFKRREYPVSHFF